MANFFTEIFKYILTLLWPVALILIGSGLIGLGFEIKMSFLIWGGFITLLIGVIWAFFLYFTSDDII